MKDTLARVFKGWDAAAVDGILVEHMTLRKRLLRDKASWVEKGVPALSVAYYRGLKAAYRDEDHGPSKLVVDKQRDENGRPLNKQLLTALSLLRVAKPCRAALRSWIENWPTPAQKDGQTHKSLNPS